MPRLAPYGSWRSPLDLERLFAQPSPPLYPRHHRGCLYWVEARAAEGGRSVLVARAPDGAERCLTPPEFNLRSRVNEYGGRCHAFGGDQVYFTNFADQRIYRQPLDGGAPVPLTPARNADGSLGMYADLQVTPDGRWLLAVCEREYEDRENVHSIAALRLDLGDLAAEPLHLVTGCDFYAAPAVSPDGRRLAWVQWNHPHMPWDASELACCDDLPAALAAGRVADPRVVAGGPGCSVGGPVYGADGTLYFYMDREAGPEDPAADFWNLHCLRGGRVARLTDDRAEYGLPQWVLGEDRYCLPDSRRLVAVRSLPEGDELVEIEPRSGRRRVLPSGFTQFAQPAPGPGGGILCTVRSATVPPALVLLSPDGDYRPLREAEPLLPAAAVSVAEHLSFPTRDGGMAHGYFYPPRHPEYAAPPRDRPPCLVMVHGGPTSRAEPGLAYFKQYWTTQGYAVFDVNHRGSTGYGRAYRQALLGRWGELDADDVIDGVDHLVRTGRVDPGKVFIRGGSAGGYTVLRLLTRYPERFAGGACYYGIGNLVTLARSTHKFEARYLDGLLGEAFDAGRAGRPDSVYARRSPIHALDRLRCPMIVFQGLEDKVVPPELSRELVARLADRGIPHEYVEYEGEGHGFRRAETRIDALRRESRFYARLMGAA